MEPSPPSRPPRPSPRICSLNDSTLELIFQYAGLSHVKLWITHPDYSSLRSFCLVNSKWRRPAQAALYKHIRIATPRSMIAIRSRESRRLIEEFETEYLDSENQFGIDSYWLLDRIGNKGSLTGFSITYDPLRGDPNGQAERDEEWLEWDILRHPALTGIKNLCCKADFKDPSDISPITLPLRELTFGKLPLPNGTALHKALLTSMNTTLRTICLDFAADPVPKAALDDLIEHFQTTATTLEFLHFLNKPNLNFLMSLHSKMNATKMPNFYSVTYPLLPKALAPFNVLCLACINNGTSLVEFKLVEPPYYTPEEVLDDDDHEALVLRYLAAFGSRLDSFNIMGRRFRFMFPREWSARFVKVPEVAKFIDRSSARGCDVWCGIEQRFSAAAKAVEKRKGKRVAKGSAEEEGLESAERDALSGSPAGSEQTSGQVEQTVLQAAAAAATATKKKKAGSKTATGAAGIVLNGKRKGKGKAAETGKGETLSGKGKGKAKAEVDDSPFDGCEGGNSRQLTGSSGQGNGSMDRTEGSSSDLGETSAKGKGNGEGKA
ncbi:hypothetical protein JCM11491_004777 [Sporobolomyces phaffii]